jgi:O-antigen/teichoic acid export membrane protein
MSPQSAAGFRFQRRVERAVKPLTDRLGLDRGITREVSALGAATIGSQIIASAAVIVLTRLYDPEDFGIYAATLSITSIILVTGCLRYEQAIPIAESHTQAAQLIVLSVCLGTIVLALAGGLLLVLEPWIAPTLGIDSLRPYVGLILLAGTVAVIGVVLQGWAVRARAFTDLARARLSSAVGLVVAQISLGLAGVGAAGLLLGDALGRGGGTMRLARRLWRDEGAEIRRVRLASLPAVARRYRRFPVLSGPSAILDVVNLQLPTLTVVAMFGSATAGVFLLAGRVVSLPNSMAMGALAPVFVAESARVRTDRDALQRLFDRTVRRLLIFGVVPTTVIVLAGPTLFAVVFGQDWEEAGVFAALLAPMYFVQLLTAPISGILSVLERQDLHLAKEIGNLLLMILVIAVASTSKWTAVPTIAALSAVGLISAIAYFLAMRHAVSRVGRVAR